MKLDDTYSGYDIELKQLSVDNGIAEYDMLQEIDANEYGFKNEANGLSHDEYKAWLIKEENYSKAQELPENWIPQTTYFLYINAQPVGIARIRHHSSELLERQGVGNFGYGIAKPYRGKGYGNLLFAETMKKCKIYGYTSVKSFVHIDNIASNKVFQNNGAQLTGVVKGIKNIYETLIK